MPRQEWPLAVVAGVVEPEGADRHQVGNLLLDGQVIVVILGPFHGGIDPAV